MSSLVLPLSQQTLLLTQTLPVRAPFCFFLCLLSFLGSWWVVCVFFFYRDKPSKWWFYIGDCRTRRLLQTVVPSISLPLFTQRSESKQFFTCTLSLFLCLLLLELVQIQCKDVLLEDSDVGKALVEYANQVIIEVLVVGASSKGGFLRCVFVFLFNGLTMNLLTGNGVIIWMLKLCRFNKPPDIPVIITKSAPDFCTVYVITKGKISTKRPASRAAPSVSPLLIEIQQNSSRPQHPRLPSPATTNTRGSKNSFVNCFFTYQSPANTEFFFFVSCSCFL